MITLVFSNHSYFIFSVDFVSEICYNKDTESEVNKMKKTSLRFDHFITLVEEARLKVGRYEYEQIVADIPHEDKKYTEQITFDVKEL